MIDQRTIALLKAPEQLQLEDLSILEREIINFPYIQSLRALYLYGTHRYNQEDYKTLLASTAAYTTDKKILYQFINKEPVKTQVEVIAEVQKEESVASSTQTLKSKYEGEKVSFPSVKAEEEVLVNELRIEDEIPSEDKDVLINQTSGQVDETIIEDVTIDQSINTDIESVIASELEENEEVEEIQLTYQDINELSEAHVEPTEIISTEIEQDSDIEIIEENFNISFQEVEELQVESVNEEVAVDVEESIENTKQESTCSTEDNSAQLSFYEKYDHLPKIQIPVSAEKAVSSLPKQNTERHLTEMERLIAEVESKLKAKKQNESNIKEIKEEEVANYDISFAENYDEPITIVEPIAEIITESKPIVEDKQPEEIVVAEVKVTTPEVVLAATEWKPLNFSPNLPDALIGNESNKPVVSEKPVEKIEQKKEEKIMEEVVELFHIEGGKDVDTNLAEEERPVLNVSFFSETVKPIDAEKEEMVIDDIKTETLIEDENSNIPKFINTWQSWLNIEKPEPVKEDVIVNTPEVISSDEEEEVIEEIKNKAIETFIETNPKISKMKEESDFIIKERSENISHLMTETLAMLYVQQKLYTKAIGGFQILIEKHPEKTEYFREKIQEVKDLRSNKS